MAYGGNPPKTTSEISSDASTLTVLVFLALSLFSVFELNTIVLSVFKHRKGLYFWSFLASCNGIAPHSIGFLLKNVIRSQNFGLYITLVAIGWVPMVTGQSLVLYSRLHLIFWNRFYMKLILGIILTNVVVLHIPIIILMYGANSSQSNSWIYPYSIYEMIQVTVFFVQELFISCVYIKTCSSFFSAPGGRNDNVRGMWRDLIAVNILVVLLDIPILCLQYLNYYDIQTAYKAFVYSIKLKIEFRILNRLVQTTQTSGNSGQPWSNSRVQTPKGKSANGLTKAFYFVGANDNLISQ